jgi:tetratricopeptide (TPR) repeat protein
MQLAAKVPNAQGIMKLRCGQVSALLFQSNIARRKRNPEKALVLLKRANDLVLKSLGATHVALSDCQTVEAAIIVESASFWEAKQLFARALDIRVRKLGKSDRKVAASLQNMAVISFLLEDWTEAIKYCEMCVTSLQEIMDEEHPDLVSMIAMKGEIYLCMGNFSVAQTFITSALRSRTSATGGRNDSEEYASSVFTKASFKRATGNAQNARQLYHEVLELQRRQHGSDSGHKDILTTLVALGANAVSCGQYAVGIEYLQQARMARTTARTARQQLQHADVDIGLGLALLASYHEDHGEIYRLLTESQAAAGEHIKKTESLRYADCLEGLAELSKRQGRYVQSLELLEQCLQIRASKQGNEAHPLVTRTKRARAEVLYVLGNYDAASALMEQVVSGEISVLGAAHPDHGDSVVVLARVLCSNGVADQAIDRLIAAWKHLRKMSPVSPMSMSRCMHVMGEVGLELNRPADSLKLLESALESGRTAFEGVLRSRNAYLASIYQSMAVAHHLGGDDAKALTIMQSEVVPVLSGLGDQVASTIARGYVVLFSKGGAASGDIDEAGWDHKNVIDAVRELCRGDRVDGTFAGRHRDITRIISGVDEPASIKTTPESFIEISKSVDNSASAIDGSLRSWSSLTAIVFRRVGARSMDGLPVALSIPSKDGLAFGGRRPSEVHHAAGEVSLPKIVPMALANNQEFARPSMKLSKSMEALPLIDSPGESMKLTIES